VIEERDSLAGRIAADGVEAIIGHAGPDVLSAANVKAARTLVSAIPNPFEASHLFIEARRANPEITILARAHSDSEVEHLKSHGANVIVMGEEEIARAISTRLLERSDIRDRAPVPVLADASTPTGGLHAAADAR
jgi:CPA2 family monovalent cation:H+ antiporter-2